MDGDTFTVHSVNGVALNAGEPVTLASGAVVTVQANGDYSFDPRGVFDFVPEGAGSADSFTYAIVDEHGAVSDEALVLVSVTGVNDAPTLSATTTFAEEDGPTVDIDLSALGSDEIGRAWCRERV